MPRRIPDYADGYASWNQLITLGSFLTLFSVIVFLFVIIQTFSTTNTKTAIALRGRWDIIG
jgi:cytochrome c oxidase subunit 1